MFANWSGGGILFALALTYFIAGYLEYLHKDAKKRPAVFFAIWIVGFLILGLF
jgi:uncharacterized protein (DUF983 family)